MLCMDEGQVSHSKSFNEDEGWEISTLQGKTRRYEWMKARSGFSFRILNEDEGWVIPTLQERLNAMNAGFLIPNPSRRMKVKTRLYGWMKVEFLIPNPSRRMKRQMLWIDEGRVSHSESFKERLNSINKDVGSPALEPSRNDSILRIRIKVGSLVPNTPKNDSILPIRMKVGSPTPNPPSNDLILSMNMNVGSGLLHLKPSRNDSIRSMRMKVRSPTPKPSRNDSILSMHQGWASHSPLFKKILNDMAE
ncbi:uncharacterized protein G2W53_010443 [Senna tora]|uniref:Uncharacterized protein n=1 Tax=Senna tora TaxID=362788 RepID=A0A834WZW8_9FABA|nr:uncharacterized protein G2W53_010443 [Senna tora]